MNFHRLQKAIQKFDEVRVIGEDVEEGELLGHIIGMTRQGEEVSLYILEPGEEPEKWTEEEEAETETSTIRIHMKQTGRRNLFLKGIRVGDQEFVTQSANSGPILLDIPTSCLEDLLLFYEMQKAGWSLPKEHCFLRKDWRNLFLTKLDFAPDTRWTEQGLPHWKGEKLVLHFDQENQEFFVEKPVCLRVGEEQEFVFELEDGRSGVCYINKVYLMDIWAEQEKRFEDPRYLEQMSREELETMKQEFFETLAENCPKGQYYLGIEYECSLEGNLIFYEKAFLDQAPETHSGSARSLLMMLRPEEKIGSHKRPLHGCVIQRPYAPDTKQVEAELFAFVARKEGYDKVLG